jgi:predicted MFS family arabinose efflux permease
VTASSRWGALAERNFRLLFLARAVSSLGDRITLVALAFAVLEFGDATDLGLVIAAREVPTVLLLLVGGVWADRLPRRRLLIASDLLRFGSQAATAALVLGGSASLASLAALQVAYGVGSAFFLPASTSVVPQTVSPGRLQQANALLAVSRNSVGITGAAIGAFLVVVVGPGWALAVDAATFLLAALFIVRLRIEEPARQARQRLMEDLKGGWVEFSSRTWVWVVVCSFGVFQLAAFPTLMVLGPVVAKDDLGGAGAWAAILAAGSAGALIGSFAAMRVRSRHPLALSQILIVPFGIQFVLLAVAAPVWAIASAAFIAWAGSEIGDTLWFTTLQRHVPEEALGRISSFDYMGSQTLNPIGFAIVGPVAAAVGVGAVIFGAAAVLTVMAGVVLLVPSVWLRDELEG